MLIPAGVIFCFFHVERIKNDATIFTYAEGFSDWVYILPGDEIDLLSLNVGELRLTVWRHIADLDVG